MAKHTKGPWRVGETDAFGDLYITNGEHPVAEAYFEYDADPKPKRLPVRANAALIASAPTLLAQRDALLAAAEAALAECPTCSSTLISTVAQMELHYDRQPTHKQLRAAVQAAKGGAE